MRFKALRTLKVCGLMPHGTMIVVAHRETMHEVSGSLDRFRAAFPYHSFVIGVGANVSLRFVALETLPLGTARTTAEEERPRSLLRLPACVQLASGQHLDTRVKCDRHKVPGISKMSAKNFRIDSAGDSLPSQDPEPIDM